MPSKNKVYTFSIDQANPKYKALIEALENMDKGSRSFVIRQILNSYFGEVKDSNNIFNIMRPVDKKEEKQETNVKEVTEESKKPIINHPPELKNLKNKFGH